METSGNDWSHLVPPDGTTWTPTRTVTVCIPCRDPTHNLVRTLEGLALQTYPHELIEVVIADDGSAHPVDPPDGLPFPVRVERLEKTLAFGAGRARNAAARAASGSILVFLDADVVPEQQVIACYARWFEQRPDVVPMGLCRFADMDDLSDLDLRRLLANDGLAAHFAGREVDDQEWRENTFRRTDDLRIDAVDAFRIVVGATFAVAAEQFWAVGGFRELGVRGVEDTELGYRLHTNGAVLILDRDANHWHQGRRNMSQERKEAIQAQREPYVTRLIPVRGFRRDPPEPLEHPVETVPRAVVHVLGPDDPSRLEAISSLAPPDLCVIAGERDPEPRSRVPFVPAFCHIFVPPGARLSDRSLMLMVRELGRRSVGVVAAHSPDGDALVAVTTRAWRRVGSLPFDRRVDAAAEQFGIWHVAAAKLEVEWGRPIDPVPTQQPGEFISQPGVGGGPASGTHVGAVWRDVSRTGRRLRRTGRRLRRRARDGARVFGTASERVLEKALRRMAQ